MTTLKVHQDYLNLGSSYTIGFNWLCTEGRRWGKNVTRTRSVRVTFLTRLRPSLHNQLKPIV